MQLLYKQISPNGSVILQYNKKLSNFVINKVLKTFLSKNGVKLSKCNSKITISPILLGGKGAFRQLMRNVGRTTNKSQNQSMARDLTGRRIRDVENEKRLEDWIDGHAEREAQKQVERTEKLEKLAKIGREEENRKRFLDADFDNESQDMMDKMTSALDYSLIRPEETRILKRPKELENCSKMLSKNSRSEKRSKLTFGFTEDVRVSSESEEDISQKIKEALEDEHDSFEVEKDTFNEEKIIETDTIDQVETEQTQIIETNISKPLSEEPNSPETKNKDTPTETSSDDQEDIIYTSINLKKIVNKSDLEIYKTKHLQAELNRRGLKAGGTIEQKIHRLYFVRDLKWSKIPKKFKNPDYL